MVSLSKDKGRFGSYHVVEIYVALLGDSFLEVP